MDRLMIEARQREPEVDFDPVTGLLVLSGRSIPENAYELYRPILQWMDNYVRQPADKTTLEFRLSYFNSSSAEHILELIKRLEPLCGKGRTATVRWYFEEDDEDMLQIGEDFASMVPVPLELVAQPRADQAEEVD